MKIRIFRFKIQLVMLGIASLLLALVMALVLFITGDMEYVPVIVLWMFAGYMAIILIQYRLY